MRTKVFLAAILLLFCAAHIQAQADKNNSLQKLYADAVHLQSVGDISEAQIGYQNFLTRALVAVAAARVAAGNVQHALKLVDAAVGMEPKDPEVWMQATKIARKADALDIAKEYALQWVTADPQNTDAYLELGEVDLSLHASNEALQQIQAAVALDASYRNGLALARVYLQMKDMKDAEQVFSEITHAFGDKAALHYDIGLAYAENGFPEQAIVEFKKSIAENKKLPGVHYSLGASYLQLMGEIDFPEAEKEFHAELAINPKDFLSDSQLGYIALTRHQYASAEHYLLRAAELNPSDPDIQISLGQMYVDLHEPAKAQVALRTCIQDTQDVARNNYQVQRAHYLLGRILLAQGKIDEAKSEMQISQKILQMSTQKNQGNTVLGTMQAAQQIPVEEPPHNVAVSPKEVQKERAYEASLRAPIANSYNNLGVIAAQSGQFSQALQYFQSAKEWDPGMDGLDLNIGRAAYASQKFDQAVEPLKSYLAEHPDNLNARIMLAASQFEIKDYASAIASLNPVRNTIRANPSVESMYEEAERRLQLQPKDGSPLSSAQ